MNENNNEHIEILDEEAAWQLHVQGTVDTDSKSKVIESHEYEGTAVAGFFANESTDLVFIPAGAIAEDMVWTNGVYEEIPAQPFADTWMTYDCFHGEANPHTFATETEAREDFRQRVAYWEYEIAWEKRN